MVVHSVRPGHYSHLSYLRIGRDQILNASGWNDFGETAPAPRPRSRSSISPPVTPAQRSTFLMMCGGPESAIKKTNSWCGLWVMIQTVKCLALHGATTGKIWPPSVARPKSGAPSAWLNLAPPFKTTTLVFAENRMVSLHLIQWWLVWLILAWMSTHSRKI